MPRRRRKGKGPKIEDVTDVVESLGVEAAMADAPAGSDGAGAGAGAGAGTGADGTGDVAAVPESDPVGATSSTPSSRAPLDPFVAQMLTAINLQQHEQQLQHDQASVLIRDRDLDTLGLARVLQLADAHARLRQSGHEFYFTSAGAALRMGDFPFARRQLLCGIAAVYSEVVREVPEIARRQPLHPEAVDGVKRTLKTLLPALVPVPVAKTRGLTNTFGTHHTEVDVPQMAAASAAAAAAAAAKPDGADDELAKKHEEDVKTTETGPAGSSGAGAEDEAAATEDETKPDAPTETTTTEEETEPAGKRQLSPAQLAALRVRIEIEEKPEDVTLPAWCPGSGDVSMTEMSEWWKALSATERAKLLSVDFKSVSDAADTPLLAKLMPGLDCAVGRKAVKDAAHHNTTSGMPTDQQLRLMQEEVVATVTDMLWTVGAPESYDQMVDDLKLVTEKVETPVALEEPKLLYTPCAPSDLLQVVDMSVADFKSFFTYDAHTTPRPTVNISSRFQSEIGLEFLLRLGSPAAAAGDTKTDESSSSSSSSGGLKPAQLEPVNAPEWNPASDTTGAGAGAGASSSSSSSSSGIPKVVEAVPGYSSEAEARRRAYLLRRPLFDAVENDCIKTANNCGRFPELDELLMNYADLADVVTFVLVAGTTHFMERMHCLTAYLEAPDLPTGSSIPPRDSLAIPGAFKDESGEPPAPSPLTAEEHFETVLKTVVPPVTEQPENKWPFTIAPQDVLKPSEVVPTEELLARALPGFDAKGGWDTVKPVLDRLAKAREDLMSGTAAMPGLATGDPALFSAAGQRFEPYASPANVHVGTSLQYVHQAMMARAERSERLRRRRRGVPVPPFPGDGRPLLPTWSDATDVSFTSGSRHSPSPPKATEPVKLPAAPDQVPTDLRSSMWTFGDTVFESPKPATATDESSSSSSSSSAAAAAATGASSSSEALTEGVAPAPACRTFGAETVVSYDDNPAETAAAVYSGELQPGDLDAKANGRRKPARNNSSRGRREKLVRDRVAFVRKHRAETLSWFDVGEDVADAVIAIQREAVVALKPIAAAVRTVAETHPTFPEDKVDTLVRLLQNRILGSLREMQQYVKISTGRWHVRQLLKPYLVPAGEEEKDVAGRVFVHRSAGNHALVRLTAHMMLTKVVDAYKASKAEEASKAEKAAAGLEESKTESKKESTTTLATTNPTGPSDPAKIRAAVSAFFKSVQEGLGQPSSQLNLGTLASVMRKTARVSPASRDALAEALGMTKIAVVGAQFLLPNAEVNRLMAMEHLDTSLVRDPTYRQEVLRVVALKDGNTHLPYIVGHAFTTQPDGLTRVIPVVNWDKTGRKCFSCHTRAVKVTCNDCGCRHYCSRECQVEAWYAPNGHATECATLAALVQKKLRVITM